MSDRSTSVIRLPRSERGRALLVVAGLIVLLALPLTVGLGVLHYPRWYPLFDNAQTELRIRDVWSRHPPLIGLVGRLGSPNAPGSHPGPLSFWMLWPVWRLFGASAWGMQVSTGIIHILAMGAVVWMAKRRGGLRLAVAVTVMLVPRHAVDTFNQTRRRQPATHLVKQHDVVMVFGPVVTHEDQQPSSIGSVS